MTIYRPVPGHRDLYAAPDGTIVKGGYGPLEPKLYPSSPYYQVYTRCGNKVNGKGGTQFVHALVAAAFFGEPADGMVVRHGLGGMHDNSIGNLCYGTYQDNYRDAVRDGTHRSLVERAKTECPKGHPYSPENTRVNPRTNKRYCRKCSADGCRAYRARRAMRGEC